AWVLFYVLLCVALELLEVHVQRRRRRDLVDHAVEAGHEAGREREVRVAGRVGRAELEATGLGLVEVCGDAYACRTVAHGVDEVDRRLVAWDQAAVAIRGGRSEREDRRCVLQETADVVAGHGG